MVTKGFSVANRVFWVVARVCLSNSDWFLGQYSDFLKISWVVNRQLLRCFGGCQAVVNTFCVVVCVLLCSG